MSWHPSRHQGGALGTKGGVPGTKAAPWARPFAVRGASRLVGLTGPVAFSRLLLEVVEESDRAITDRRWPEGAAP